MLYILLYESVRSSRIVTLIRSCECPGKVREPLADEFLGRERVTDAKGTRLACDSAVERFESIVEGPSLWHMQSNPFGRLKILLAFHLGSLHCTVRSILNLHWKKRPDQI